MKLSSSCGALLSNQGISRHGRHIRGGPQPGRAVRDGSGIDRGCPSGETKMVQSSRHLPDDGAAVELIDDRTCDVADVPATGEANTSQGSS